ncbi:unnamed protein product [Paramecium octaurelia]|uniref:Uncharacterized protein n=1 Tax=Paramecium octaurelia TaxID=43137 RepID=A0A8S1WV50_PAROT|nr:unnamed protein product [Paramecium octaurelia]
MPSVNIDQISDTYHIQLILQQFLSSIYKNMVVSRPWQSTPLISLLSVFQNDTAELQFRGCHF